MGAKKIWNIESNIRTINFKWKHDHCTVDKMWMNVIKSSNIWI